MGALRAAALAATFIVVLFLQFGTAGATDKGREKLEQLRSWQTAHNLIELNEKEFR